ncbi:MAG: hypothetical protein SO250_04800 [Enterocloster clostridioformis]|uniref:hypothetical protein n=1 Tax=Enterocloster clostridioformis TaxID=1531 RepID=UPI002A83ECF3|nr:hypothetical protein [Enterocloster clostridioformis]MDY4763371.1 hypothetical protein [Enterocloster clostridioformis]
MELLNNQDLLLAISGMMDDKLEKKLEQKLIQSEQRLEIKLKLAMEQTLEEKLEEKLEQKLDRKLEEKLDRKLEEKLEQKLEQKLEEKLEQKLEQKLDEKLEQKLDEKLEQKLDEKLERKLDEKLAPIRADITILKEQVLSLTDRMGRVEADIEDIRKQQERTSKIIENQLIPNIQLLAENYVPAARRYQESEQKQTAMENDIKLLKIVVADHSAKLCELAK